MIGDVPEALYYLAKGVFPWDLPVDAAPSRLKERAASGKSTAKIAGNAFFNNLFAFVFEKFGGKTVTAQSVR